MKILPALLAAILLSQGVALSQDNGIIDQSGRHVRVIRNDDGSQSLYEKTPGQKGMRRLTYDQTGTLKSIIVYLTGKWDQLTSCKVYDGDKNELYKVAYGYDEGARLMEEQMFDSKKIDPATGKNLLVRRFIYTYDEQGNRSKPICIVLVKGKEYDKFETTAPKEDPFAPKK